MDKGRLAKVIVSASLLSAMGFALYLAGISGTGSIVSVGGTQPETAVYENLDLDLNESLEDIVAFYYTNGDGATDFNFTLSENITSIDEQCTYEIGKDINWSIQVNSAGWYPFPHIATMNTGSNAIEVKAIGDANSCPINGTWAITGVLA
jgi:hypothetical protein